MKILFVGLGIFFLALVLHLVIWRLWLPKRQTKTLLELFLTVLFVSFIYFISVGNELNPFTNFLPLQLHEYLHIGFLYISLTLFYVVNHSAIEADSPSLIMLLEISKAGNKGVKKEDFLNNLSDDLLVIPRINDLILAKTAYMHNDKYYISKKGRIFVQIFVLYRKFLRLPKGG